MDRPVALITGGNSGIGLECARSLARAGWHVVMASRDRDTSANAVRRLEQESGEGAAAEMGLDLGSLDSVRAFVKDVDALDLPIRALVCNAGIQVNGPLRRSADGHEITFAVNHLGHFLLTNLLLSRILANAPARIVVVASGVHDPKMKTGMPHASIPSPDVVAERGSAEGEAFNGRLAYVNSKLCNLWFAYELARRIEEAGLSGTERPLSVNAYEPGLVPGSGLGRDYPAPIRFVWNYILPGIARAVSPFVPTINPADKSGNALAGVVLDPALERTSGKYFPSHSRWKEAPSSDASYDTEAARALWDTSVRLARLTPEDSPLVGAP